MRTSALRDNLSRFFGSENEGGGSSHVELVSNAEADGHSYRCSSREGQGSMPLEWSWIRGSKIAIRAIDKFSHIPRFYCEL